MPPPYMIITDMTDGQNYETRTQERHFLLKTDAQAHTVTFIAVSDILPASYSAKTDLFAFKTHSAPVIIAIVTGELKP